VSGPGEPVAHAEHRRGAFLVSTNPDRYMEKVVDQPYRRAAAS
jgi:hypothetical protein